MAEKKPISFQKSEEVEGAGEAFVDTSKLICGQCVWATIRVYQQTRTEAKKDAKPIGVTLFGSVFAHDDYVRMFHRRLKVNCRSPLVVGPDGKPEAIEGEEIINCDAFEARERKPCQTASSATPSE